MPLSEMHRQVAAIALRAAAGHGFALGGGNALIQHGVISRPTQDVDLFTDQETGVLTAAGAVEAALRGAGFEAERQDMTVGLAGIFPGMGEELAEWIITAPDGEQMALQLAYFDRARDPVLMDVGPVLDLEDVVGGKVCALASRAYERDYLDTAAALERYTPAELIGMAQRLDPGLEGRDFAEAAQRLDQMPDSAFTAFGLSQRDVTRLRERFAAWPRDAQVAGTTAGMDTHTGHPAEGIPAEGSDRASGEIAADQSPGFGHASRAEPDEPELEP
jgi:hypothetical protein